MTREEFILEWYHPGYMSEFAASLDALLSATRKAALEEAREAAYDHSCRGYLCNCRGHIMDAIAKAKENQ